MIAPTTSSALALAASLAFQPQTPAQPPALTAERMEVLKTISGPSAANMGIEEALKAGTRILKTYPTRDQVIDFAVSAVSDDPNQRLLSKFCAHALNVVDAPAHKLFAASEKVLVTYNGQSGYVPTLPADQIENRIKVANDFIKESARACGYEVKVPAFGPNQ